MVPCGCLFVATCVFLDISAEDPLKSLFAFRDFASRTSDLHNSPREDLAVRIEVLVILQESSKEPVDAMKVVPAPKHVDDCSGDFVEVDGGYAGSLDAVEGGRINFEMIAVALASTVAGQNLSFRSCWMALVILLVSVELFKETPALRCAPRYLKSWTTSMAWFMWLHQVCLSHVAAILLLAKL